MNLTWRRHILDLLLLAGMLISMTASFVHVRWTWGLEALIWTSLGGLLAGFLLARSRFSPRVAHCFGLIYGAVATTLAVSRNLSQGMALRVKFIEIALRTWAWLGTAWQGRGRSDDALVFVLQLAFLAWWIGYIAAWFAFRRQQVWGAVVPSGLFFFWNLYYTPVPLTGYLLVYLLCALLLVAHLTLRQREERWQREAVGFSTELEIDVLRYGAYFALGLISLAWLVPPLTHPEDRVFVAWTPAEEVSVRVQREWQRLFSGLEVHTRGPGELYGVDLPFPGPVRLGDESVLTIQAPAGHYYWRAVAYDTYTGREWRNTDSELAYVAPRSLLSSIPNYAMRQEMTQTITAYLPGTTVLFGASQPVRMDLPAKVYYALSEQGAFPPSLWQSTRPLRPQETYMAISSISVAGEEDLLRAGNSYPSWARERYLQLPDGLPTRVISLAHSIVAREANPYAQVSALEEYLRLIPYNEQTAEPPAGRDGVDYFLFDQREGYCIHYASALAMMARVLGIPARLAAGYASGEYDSTDGVFAVSRADSHAWPEVFFPGYGWVEFEPTAAQPRIVRPKPVVAEGKQEGASTEGLSGREQDRNRQIPEDEPLPPPGEGGVSSPSAGGWAGLLKAAGIAMLAGALAATGMTVRWWRTRRYLTSTAWAYARLVNFGHRLACSYVTGQTPYEYAHALARVIPQANASIHGLVELYVAECFGQRRAPPDEVEEVWGRLRSLLWRSWLRQWWASSSVRILWGNLRRVFG